MIAHIARPKDIALATVEIVESVITRYSQILIEMALTGDHGEIRNANHEGNFLSRIDLELHTLYEAELARILPSFIYASEEGDPVQYSFDSSTSPEFVVIVDPMDMSELAVRGLNGHTQVIIFSMESRRPIAAVVGDMFHEIRIFYAYQEKDDRDVAFLKTRRGLFRKLRVSMEAELQRSLVTSYLMRPEERFNRIAREKLLLDTLNERDVDGERRGRIGLDFGSIGLCHVAAGFTDAMIEIAKGFKLWDLYPGQYILEAAGGIVASPEGERLPLTMPLYTLDDVNLAMDQRQKFIAAGNERLIKEIVNRLS